MLQQSEAKQSHKLGREDVNRWILVWGRGDRGLFSFSKILFPFPLSPTKLIGDFFEHWQSKPNMFRITVPYNIWKYTV
jgi:hypothetical protein